MSVALQVCIRCRPFAHDDSLGVVIRSNADGGGDGEKAHVSDQPCAV